MIREQRWREGWNQWEEEDGANGNGEVEPMGTGRVEPMGEKRVEPIRSEPLRQRIWSFLGAVRSSGLA